MADPSPLPSPDLAPYWLLTPALPQLLMANFVWPPDFDASQTAVHKYLDLLNRLFSCCFFKTAIYRSKICTLSVPKLIQRYLWPVIQHTPAEQRVNVSIVFKWLFCFYFYVTSNEWLTQSECCQLYFNPESRRNCDSKKKNGRMMALDVSHRNVSFLFFLILSALFFFSLRTILDASGARRFARTRRLCETPKQQAACSWKKGRKPRGTMSRSPLASPGLAWPQSDHQQPFQTQDIPS